MITPPIVGGQPPVSASGSSPLSGGEDWKEAFEKLRHEFEKFKKEMMEEMAILANDLDAERKKSAGMAVDIDRLKKTREFR